MEDRIPPQRVRTLLKRLVDIYSPSGKENDVLDFLTGYMKRRWISTTIQPVDDNRYNLLVLPETDDIRLALIGHVDTVAAYDLENYGYVREGDTISGLGAADMKGGCAAMIEAYLMLRELCGHQVPVALCLVVGEEETGDGAAQLATAYHFPWVIIGEPTNLTPCLSSYGYLEVQISARGKRRHASLGNRRENVIEVILHMMLRISHHMKRERQELVYNIRDLQSLRTGFTVPEHCEAWLDIHIPPGLSPKEIMTELEAVSQPESDKSSEIETTINAHTIAAGYELLEKGQVVDALRTVYAQRRLAWRTPPFPSHSDANQLWEAGMKPIVMGPGQLEMAHSQDESVSFEQVCLAAELYLDAMLRMFR